ncbi:hypothetical protein HanPI659440_Chr05g0195881 [Helianthus annuus]|nr:hypothetical protein HanPI659440_Chr05g0195881 [Helianthus annuus]
MAINILTDRPLELLTDDLMVPKPCPTFKISLGYNLIDNEMTNVTSHTNEAYQVTDGLVDTVSISLPNPQVIVH